MRSNIKLGRRARTQLACIAGLLAVGCDPEPVGSSGRYDFQVPASSDDGSGATGGSQGESVRGEGTGGNGSQQEPPRPGAPTFDDGGTIVVHPDAGSVPDASGPLPLDCESVNLPTAGLLGRLTAGAGVATDASGVSAWQDQANPQRAAKRVSGGPALIADAVAGRPALRFDGTDDVLHWGGWQLNGKTALTLALVNATDRKAPPQEWCCSDDETGCSGTYHVPLFWNGTADWSGILIAPVQDEVALRFGNGVKHYSDNFYDTQAWKVCGNGLPSCPGGIAIGSNPNCCGYGSCQVDWKRDPGVAWTRPVSVGRNFTLSVTVKDPTGYELFVAGESVWRRPMPGGVAEIKNVEDYARIGSAGPFGGRRWQGDIAEIVVYDRALDQQDRTALERYLTCQYFPGDP